VHVDAERSLRNEPDRFTCRQGDLGHLSQLDCDLDRAVPGADHDHALTGERLRTAIDGGVQQLAAGLAMIPVAIISRDWTIHWNVRGVSAPSVPSAIAVMLAAAEIRMPVERLITSAVVLSPT